MKYGMVLLLVMSSFFSRTQTKTFRFAFVSDTHIGSPNGAAEEDLRRTVADINTLKDLAFVVITGDITELGTDLQLEYAKKILDSLHIPYYIIPGNHDTGWSESGGLSFTRIFGSDQFSFDYQGIHFLGCASGPYVRMSDGHVPRNAVNWLRHQLNQLKSDEPVIFLNHYPLDNGLDNWYEVIDLLKTKNTLLALCGHGHQNRIVQAENIPSVMGRSNLRAKEAEGGYNLVEVQADSIYFTERKSFTHTEKRWTSVPNQMHVYDLKKKFPRPDFSVNSRYAQVSAVWSYSSASNVMSTPALFQDLVVFGNQDGVVEALDISTGKLQWKFLTHGPVYSSPATTPNRIVVGSADHYIYCLDVTGHLQWKHQSGGPVLGSPLIDNQVVYIGGSDHTFRAFNLKNGHLLWSFRGLEGPVMGKPVIQGKEIIFGAWDTNLYALDKTSGKLIWKWNNGSSVINFSPAACTPVVQDHVVYIVAPDRYLTAIDQTTGVTLWRTPESTVRESIGISQNGSLIFGKTMQDTVVAFYTNKLRPMRAWSMNVGFGYEHVPSMLIEKGNSLFFGTRNGVVYAIDPGTQKLLWAYKMDNSMVNTVNVLNEKQLIASTMDGKVCLLHAY